MLKKGNEGEACDKLVYFSKLMFAEIQAFPLNPVISQNDKDVVVFFVLFFMFTATICNRAHSVCAIKQWSQFPVKHHLISQRVKYNAALVTGEFFSPFGFRLEVMKSSNIQNSLTNNVAKLC